ncbi:hypothetical protein KBX50_08360 [Micromonospora sp. C51]|uniref:hypothetical protein n=1 Tax=Micromonospora sp. C51 TaxID=2824879 RepID=UPI001B37D95F|nr:hypothetical protein [Micromonospora sp. C51]MBQ1048476.1 hypothetical protein [Micromonospora sp. C51]
MVTYEKLRERADDNIDLRVLPDVHATVADALDEVESETDELAQRATFLRMLAEAMRDGKRFDLLELIYVIGGVEAALVDVDDADELIDQVSSLKALDEALVGNEWAIHDGRTMIPKNNWETFCRDFAEGITGDIDLIASYVDWKRFADDMQTDYKEIRVESGDFHGTWYVHG